MLERRNDCSRIVCKISPFSSECSRSRQPKLVGDNPGRLPKLARPCDPSSGARCNLGNFFPRPPDVFKMVPGGFKVVPGGFRPPETMENQISFCKDGTLDPRCRPAGPPRSRLPTKGAETPTIRRPVTDRPIKTSQENTPPPAESQRPQNTNGISNRPLNSFNPTLSPGPIKNNIVTPARIKTGNRENNNPMMRSPKQLEGTGDLCNGLNSGDCKTSNGQQCQSNGFGCGQLVPDLTSPRIPVSVKPEKNESPEQTVVSTLPSDSPNFSTSPRPTPGTSTDSNIPVSTRIATSFTDPPSNSLRDTSTLSPTNIVTNSGSLKDAPLGNTPNLPSPEFPATEFTTPLELDPTLSSGPEKQSSPDHDRFPLDLDFETGTSDPHLKNGNVPTTARSKKPNLQKEVLVPRRPTSMPNPSRTTDPSPPSGKSTPFDVKLVRVPLTDPQPFSPTGLLPSSFSLPTSSPSFAPLEPSPIHHPVSHGCTEGDLDCLLQEQTLDQEDPSFIFGDCKEKEAGCSDEMVDVGMDPKLRDPEQENLSKDPKMANMDGKDSALAHVDNPDCHGGSCQGPHQQEREGGSDPIKIDNHDCPPTSPGCSATVPPEMKDAGVMNAQVTVKSPLPPLSSNGLELGKTLNVVPSPRPQTPTSTMRTIDGNPLSFEGSGKKSGEPSPGGGPNPLPTPSPPPSKANQPGMLNGANQERPGIPPISLDAGHPRPRPVGSTGDPLGRQPAQPASKKQSPPGGRRRPQPVPDPGRPQQLAPCTTGPPHHSCPQELPRKPKSGPSLPTEPPTEFGKRLPTGTRADCKPGSLADECWPEEDPCEGGDPNCWPFDFSRETARSCLANGDTEECAALALAYQRYCNSHPVSRLCVSSSGRNTDPAPAAGQPSRPGSGVTRRPPIECSTAGHRDPICRFPTNAALSPSQQPLQTFPPAAPLGPLLPQKNLPKKLDRKKLFNPAPKKTPIGPVKAGKDERLVNPNKSRKPPLEKGSGQDRQTESDPERERERKVEKENPGKRGRQGKGKEENEGSEREVDGQLDDQVAGGGDGGGRKEQVTRQAGQSRPVCNNVNGEHTAHQARVLGLFAQDLLHDHHDRQAHHDHHDDLVWLITFFVNT